MSDTSASTRPDTERTVVYPSVAVPAVPAFVFTGAVGWTIEEAPGALVVLRAPQQSDGSALDAVLRHNRVPGELTLEEAAKRSWARIQREAPDVKLSFERVATFGTNIAYLRGYSYAVDGSTTAELHALFLAPKGDGRKTADLFQLSVTGAPEVVRRRGEEFLDMVASFRFV
jgi:hypothetical protein